MEKEDNGTWRIGVKGILIKDTKKDVSAKFIFIGAGGGSLSLLEKSDIPEGKGFGGFPVGGQWLRCTNEKVIEQHHAKVYGKAAVGAPPMSVPHLDTRFIDGKKALLFGHYAGFSTKFLKNGYRSGECGRWITCSLIGSFARGIYISINHAGITRALFSISNAI